MTERTYSVARGGLMRCCLASLDAAHVEDFDALTAAGHHECRWCRGRVALVDDAWRWVPPTPTVDLAQDLTDSLRPNLCENCHLVTVMFSGDMCARCEDGWTPAEVQAALEAELNRADGGEQ